MTNADKIEQEIAGLNAVLSLPRDLTNLAARSELNQIVQRREQLLRELRNENR
jgi:hypothetical protein